MQFCMKLRVPQHPGGGIAHAELLKVLVNNTYTAAGVKVAFKLVELDVSWSPLIG